MYNTEAFHEHKKVHCSHNYGTGMQVIGHLNTMDLAEISRRVNNDLW